MIEIKCANCGKTFYRTPSKGNTLFCCMKCYSTYKRKKGGSLTDEQKRCIEDNYLTRTYRDISIMTGVSIGRINRYIHGVLKSQVYNDRLTDEQRQKIDEYRRQGGHSLKEIADLLDVGYYQVVNQAARTKIERKNRKYTKDKLNFIRNTYQSSPCNAGLLAEKMGVSATTIKRLATMLGVTRKYKSHKRELKNGRGRSSQQAIQ